jgi:NAD(P)-dependent dehydrogenase (short-subunit alcohol dehydrogenase family)
MPRALVQDQTMTAAAIPAPGLLGDAAVVRHRPLADWDAADFDRHVATNVRGPYFLIQAAVPDLAASPVRSVVNISSSSGAVRLSGQSVYGMTKAALNYLTISLAAELAACHLSAAEIVGRRVFTRAARPAGAAS